jgi:Transglutaminase-like superfamily
MPDIDVRRRYANRDGRDRGEHASRRPDRHPRDPEARQPSETPVALADADHPLVREAAAKLVEGSASQREQLDRFVLFVRDEILFGFPPNGDMTAASDTLRLGIGQCNTKGTLLLALCRSVGIPARLHFAPIRRSIQRGLYSGVWYLLLPRHLSHAWLEVNVDGRWRRVDAYINDERFCQAAAGELDRRGWQEGFSLAGGCSGASAVFDLDSERFVQMDAVEGDHGIWDDPADYYRSSLYLNRVGAIKRWLYRQVRPSINRRVEVLRGGARDQRGS